MKKSLLHTVCLFAVSALPAVSAHAQETFPYANDFTSEELPNMNGPQWDLDIEVGFLNYFQPTGGGTSVGSATAQVPGAVGGDFVVSTWLTVNEKEGSVNSITTGFGALADEDDFSGAYYLTDWAIGGGGTGNLRILALPSKSGFSNSGGNAGLPEIGESYELRLTGEYVDGTLNMTLAVFDESGVQLGTSATATDTEPLTGEFFGLRNRSSHNTHLLDAHYHVFGIGEEPQPLPPPPPPLLVDITNLNPAPDTGGHPAIDGLQFTVSTEEPNTIDPADIELVLNGETILNDDLTITGSSPSFDVSYDDLESNVIYQVEVSAQDDKRSTSRAWSFDTLDGGFAVATLEDTSLNQSAEDVLQGLVPESDFEGSLPEGGTLGQLTDAESADTPGANVISSSDTPVSLTWDLGDPDSAAHRSLTRIDIWIAGFDPWRTGYDGEFAVSNDGENFTVIPDSRFATALTYTGDTTEIEGEEVVGTGTGNVNLVRYQFDPEDSYGGFRYLRFTSYGFDNLGELDDNTVRQPRIVEIDAFATIGNPVITGINPPHEGFFHPAGEGLQFSVSTEEPNTIAEADIELYLNGEAVSSGELEIIGASPAFDVSYNGLDPNRLYTARAVVRDNERETTHVWTFDTLDEADLTVIEAEDYNFAAGMECDVDTGETTGTPGGGSYINDPVPSTFTDGSYYNQAEGYVDRVGTLGVDYFTESEVNATLDVTMYRWCDFAGTNSTGDLPPRPKYQEASNDAGVEIPDYDLHLVETGEWFNYTRDFAAGSYRVMLRASSTGSPVIRLERVTGDPTQPDQETEILGEFHFTGDGEYTFTSLSGPGGIDQEVFVSLSGEETLRLSAASANNLNNDVNINFVMFVPIPSVPPSVVTTTPVDHSGNVARNAAIQAELHDGSSELDLGSLRLFVNNEEVAADVTGTAEGATVSHTPGDLPFLGNTARVEFDDVAGSGPYSVSWGFSVLPEGLDTFSALQFNGTSDFVDITNAAGTFGDFTISGWFHIGEQPEQQVLFRLSNQEEVSRSIELREEGGQLTAGVRVLGGSGNSLFPISTSNFEYDTWVHIAFVREGGDLRLYLDGELEASGSAPDNEIVVERRSLIGADPWPWDLPGARFFRGYIDEFQIWKVARSQQEIVDAMFEPLQDLIEPSDALHARFGFNEGSGGEIVDYSSGSLFTAQVNATWVESEIFESVAPPELPVLNIARDGSDIVLTWEEKEGVRLESAPELGGPWTAVEGAASPHSVDASLNSRQFFRLGEDG